jgi:hypothetical protein
VTKIQVTTDNLLTLLAVLVVLSVPAYIAVRYILTLRLRARRAGHRAMTASGLWTIHPDDDPRCTALSALADAVQPSPKHAGRTDGGR